MTISFEWLEHKAIYPGHPVTLAYMIVCRYASLKEATAKGQNYPKPLEDHRIPGGGGNIHAALDFLRLAKDGLAPAFEWADRSWERCDGQKVSNTRRWRDGQAQADEIKPLLAEKLREWAL